MTKTGKQKPIFLYGKIDATLSIQKKTFKEKIHTPVSWPQTIDTTLSSEQ